MKLEDLHAKIAAFDQRETARSERLNAAVAANTAAKAANQAACDAANKAADEAAKTVIDLVTAESASDSTEMKALFQDYEGQLRTWHADIDRIAAAMRQSVAVIDPPPSPPTDMQAEFTPKE
jgi:hypothetical protein